MTRTWLRAGRVAAALAGVGALMLAACAAPGPIPRAEDFSLHDLQQGFALHWRVERDDREVRAVGLLDPGSVPFQFVSLGFFGLDGQGRTVSRGTEVIFPRGFTPAPTPFEVRAKAVAGEVRFRLVIVTFERDIRPDQ